MSLQAGRALLHYSIERKLGEGGMGEVWLARDTRLARPVALKFLKHSTSLDPQARERLAREARATSALNHPNILTIHAVEHCDGRDFIVMEYAEGRTLDRWVAAEAPDLDHLLDLAVQIGEGLQAAHDKGIVHRDIKPSNVMVSDQGRAQVMDFGLAKVSSEPRLTQTGSAVGTLAYMSPEQIEGLEVDPRSDVFSFGALLYELVTGVAPFANEAGVAATLHAILHEAPARASSLRSDLPRDLDRILEKALGKDRERRYEGMHPMLADLRALQRALRTGGVVAPDGSTRARSLGIYALGLVGLLLGMWLAFGTGSDERGPTQPGDAGGEPPEYSQRLIHMLQGSPHAATFSPDGEQIAYLNEVGGVEQLFVTGLDEGEPRQLTTGDRPAHRPRWSPVDNRILFHHAIGSDDWTRDGEVFTISALGGEPRRLLDHAYNAAWSADGERIVFEREFRVWTAAADGSEARLVEAVPRPLHHTVEQMPALSPDGQSVVFFHTELGPLGRLWIADLAGGERHALTTGLELARDPSFTPDGRWVVYSTDRGGPRTVWRVTTDPEEDQAPQPITTGVGDDGEPCLSLDGRRIVFTNARHEFVLQAWNSNTPEDEPRILRSSRSSVLYPAWSPDGSRLAMFGEGRQPGSHVLVLARDGSNLAQVTRDAAQVSLYPLWTPDGAALYYFHQGAAGAGLRRIAADGGPTRQIAEGWTLQTHPFPAVHPGGRHLLVSEFLPDRPPRFILLDVESGEEQEFPVPIFRPSYSSDGKWIVGEWPPGTLIRVDATTHDSESLGTGQVGRFAADDRSLLFLASEDDHWQLWSADPDGANRRRLRDLGRMFDQAPAYDVSPDGEVVWCEFRGGRRELWLLETP